MPWLKPEALLALQQAASRATNEGLGDSPVDGKALSDGMRVCPVCGDGSCDKKIVKSNGVFVHPEDVADADIIERPGGE